MEKFFLKHMRVRGSLTLTDLQNKWIMDGVCCVINVSSDFNATVDAQLRKMGIPYYWFPMAESNNDMGLNSIYGAVNILQPYIESLQPVIIHCQRGNNRSRVVKESLYFANYNSWLVDIDGTFKVKQNCAEGHLPPIEIYENFLRSVHEGKSLDDCLTFKCFKSKVTPNFIIKNPKLCELQVDILRLMDLLSTDEKFIPTYKVVEAYYANYSDTANGEPLRNLVDKIYAMAQPWRIKEPLLLSRGNIGAPEEVDFEYSGAADIFYTEIALSHKGKKILTEYINKTNQ